MTDYEVFRGKVLIDGVQDPRQPPECSAHGYLSVPDRRCLECQLSADYARAIAREMSDARREAEKKLPVIKTGAWLNEQVFEPLRWTVPLILPEGLSIISGPPKAGKSFLVLAVAMAVASGNGAIGFPAMPARPVLYFALEDGDRRMQQRCAELGYRQVPEGFAYVTESDPEQVLLFASKWLAENPEGLVLVDTLAKVRTPKRRDETPYDHDYRTLGAFHSLAKGSPGSSVIIVHHTRKEASGRSVDAVSGTYGVSGAVDTVLVLHRKENENTGKLMVTGRDVDEEEYGLEGFPFWRLDGGSPEAAAKAAAQAREAGALGMRSKAIMSLARDRGVIGPKDAADLLGITPQAAGVCLGRLADSGRLVKTGRGKYAAAGFQHSGDERVLKTGVTDSDGDAVDGDGTSPETTSPYISTVENVKSVESDGSVAADTTLSTIYTGIRENADEGGDQPSDYTGDLDEGAPDDDDTSIVIDLSAWRGRAG